MHREKWVEKSYRLPGLSKNPFIAADFQALGRLDQIIESMWGAVKKVEAPDDRQLTIQNDVFILSRLWVLSGYEIVRILKEADKERFDGIYKQFHKVRIPLAKYEKPGSRHTMSIAQLAYKSDDGTIGWMLQSGEFVSRESLAGGLLAAI